MHTIGSFWYGTPFGPKLLLLGLFGLACIQMVRFVILGLRLYSFTGKPVSPENVAGWVLDPDLLARAALTNRPLFSALAEKLPTTEPCTDRPAVEKALYTLRAAENRFLFLWEQCYADVASTRRAGRLTVLLSLVMIAYAAFPTYSLAYNNTNRPGFLAMLLTADELLALLALGLSLAALLYSISSFFERALAQRMARWKYFSATARNELQND
jgi:hypothetical protein